MIKIGSFILTILLLVPSPAQAHFGIDDSTQIAGTTIDKTLVLGILVLGFIILTVVFQLLKRKNPKS